MATNRTSREHRSSPTKVEDNTLDEQHAGIQPIDFPVTDNDQGPGEAGQTHVVQSNVDETASAPEQLWKGQKPAGASSSSDPQGRS